jgi:hypothetical protein
MLAATYSRHVDSAETDLAPADVERARRSPIQEPFAPGPVHDEPNPLARLQTGVGNRGFGQLVARMRDGEGIMASGLVHPDVQAAIALASGGGSSLDTAVSRRLEPAYGDSLEDVRVHTDGAAAAMARAVSARAFTVGSDIFFASGEYRPGNADGDQLIAHEAAHVLQQRGAPTTGPLTVSQPGDAMEREAEDLARGFSG